MWGHILPEGSLWDGGELKMCSVNPESATYTFKERVINIESRKQIKLNNKITESKSLENRGKDRWN